MKKWKNKKKKKWQAKQKSKKTQWIKEIIKKLRHKI